MELDSKRRRFFFCGRFNNLVASSFLFYIFVGLMGSFQMAGAVPNNPNFPAPHRLGLPPRCSEVLRSTDEGFVDLKFDPNLVRIEVPNGFQALTQRILGNKESFVARRRAVAEAAQLESNRTILRQWRNNQSWAIYDGSQAIMALFSGDFRGMVSVLDSQLVQYLKRIENQFSLVAMEEITEAARREWAVYFERAEYILLEINNLKSLWPATDDSGRQPNVWDHEFETLREQFEQDIPTFRFKTTDEFNELKERLSVLRDSIREIYYEQDKDRFRVEMSGTLNLTSKIEESGLMKGESLDRKRRIEMKFERLRSSLSHLARKTEDPENHDAMLAKLELSSTDLDENLMSFLEAEIHFFESYLVNPSRPALISGDILNYLCLRYAHNLSLLGPVSINSFQFAALTNLRKLTLKMTRVENWNQLFGFSMKPLPVLSTEDIAWDAFNERELGLTLGLLGLVSDREWNALVFEINSSNSKIHLIPDLVAYKLLKQKCLELFQYYLISRLRIPLFKDKSKSASAPSALTETLATRSTLFDGAILSRPGGHPIQFFRHLMYGFKSRDLPFTSPWAEPFYRHYPTGLNERRSLAFHFWGHFRGIGIADQVSADYFESIFNRVEGPSSEEGLFGSDKSIHKTSPIEPTPYEDYIKYELKVFEKVGAWQPKAGSFRLTSKLLDLWNLYQKNEPINGFKSMNRIISE